MDNRQNNIGNERSQGLLQFRKDDFYVSGIEDDNGFHHLLGMHKSACLFSQRIQDKWGETVFWLMKTERGDTKFWMKVKRQK